MSGLPKGWAVGSLAELCERIVDGSHNPPKTSEHGKPMLSARNIQERRIQFDEFRLISDADFELENKRTSVQANDVLLTIVGTIGRTAVVSTDSGAFALQRSVAVLRAPSLVARYLSYTLEAPAIQKMLNDNAKGTAQKGVYLTALSSIQVPLAPLPEQKRIADKLDSVLARVDACRERLDGIPTLLKRFRQSVLAAATSGRLTEDWRQCIANSDWPPTTIETLCNVLFDGPFGSNLKSDDYTENGVRVVRLENVMHLNFDANKETYISEEKYQSLQKHTLATDDILFSSFIDEEVRTCLYPNHIPTRAINKADCFVMRVDRSKCLPKFLCLRLACRTTYMDLQELVHGATRPRINLRQLKQYAVQLPPLPEQHEIVRRVDTLFAFADRLEARCTAARKQVGQLTPALLAKAFRGELVPQDPNDEPAAELLKRLAASRGDAPRARRGRRSPAPDAA